MDITSMYVDKYFTMDPQFDDLLFDGTMLKDGMVVIVEDHGLRREMTKDLTPADKHQADMFNRWASVSNLIKVGGSVKFIATYCDGVKMKMDLSVNRSWVVKKDSIPA